MSRLDRLTLSSVQNDSWVLTIAITRDLVASLGSNCSPVAVSFFSIPFELDCCENVLVLFHVQDLALGLPVAPVPAHRITRLWSILGLGLGFGLGLAALLCFIVALGFVGGVLIILLLGGRCFILGTYENSIVNMCSLVSLSIIV